MNHEPIKPLFEDASAPNELRNFVALARSDGASQADLDRLAKRMAPVLGVSAAFIASSAGAIGTSAPLSATGAFGAPLSASGAFGAPASGLTPALGAASAAKVGAASAAKAGLFGQLMASASAKVLAVGLSIGAAGVAVYNATTTERPPSGPHVPVAKQNRSARPNALPEGNPAVLHGDSTTAARVTDSPTSLGGAAPVVEALGVAEAAPRVAPRAGRSASPVSARLSAAARKASAARHAASESVPVSAPGQSLTDGPSVAQVEAEQPSLPPPSELSLIEHAEGSRTRPIEALAFLAKHEEIYPRGALAQEREVLAIELLLKAGKSGQAEARAEHFEDAYPRSAHLPHLRALLTRANAK